MDNRIQNTITIGFPRMMKEQGEKRVFLPEFIQYLASLGFQVFIEEGYGSRSGYSFDDYQQANEQVVMVSREEAYQQDYVMVLRSPILGEFQLMRRGACLISMLHFPTRPKRVALLQELGLNAISLDSIVNGKNIRLVEDMKAVGWNGLEIGFDELEICLPGLERSDGLPVHVLIFGTGMVGKHAVEAATKLGNLERHKAYLVSGGPGALAVAAGRNISNRPDIMEKLFRQSDILVDATQRRDTSKPVIPNEWIAWLPEHAIVVDLAVDPYTLDAVPPVVRGIEGIPQGNLNQYVFHPNDKHWSDSVPASIPSSHRRTTVTCYSWPGIHPEASMRHYGGQLEPLMEVLAEKGYDELSMTGGYFERALMRGSLKYWLKQGRYGARPR